MSGNSKTPGGDAAEQGDEADEAWATSELRSLSPVLTDERHTRNNVINPDDLRRFQEAVRAMAPQIEAAQAQVKQFAEQFGSTLRQAAAAYAEQMRQLQPVVQQAIAQYQALTSEAHRRIVPILRRRGWFGVAPYLDPLELIEAADLFDKRGGLAFDTRICSQFSRKKHRKLQRVTRDWWSVAYMKKRRPHVRAALKAHREGRYSLAISALLPMVEGLAAAYFRKNPGLLVRRKGKQPTVVVKDAALLHREIRADHADLLLAALSTQIYAEYKFGAARAPSALNRHGILHGEISRFGTPKNSLRTILLLDAICCVALAGPNVP